MGLPGPTVEVNLLHGAGLDDVAQLVGRGGAQIVVGMDARFAEKGGVARADTADAGQVILVAEGGGRRIGNQLAEHGRAQDPAFRLVALKAGGHRKGGGVGGRQGFD